MSTETEGPGFAALPALGQPLGGGIFAGIITQPDGTHVAVALLPGTIEGLSWRKAQTWAKNQGGVLPTRTIAALLYANLKAQLRPRLHWMSEAYGATLAWLCSFDNGSLCGQIKTQETCAVAVRLIPIGG